MEADIGTICVSAQCAHGCMRRPPHSPPPPPPPPLLLSVAAKQHRTNFPKHEILTKLFRISRNSRNILRNTKLNISRKFSKITKMKFSQPPYSYIICCTNSRLLKQSFAARQCYFEMKLIYALYFSILSSLIL